MQSRKIHAFLVLAVMGLAPLSRPAAVDQEPGTSETSLAMPAAETERKGSLAERIRLGFTASYMSGLEKIRSNAANFYSYRNIGVSRSAIAFEPRVNSAGQISLSPVLNEGALNFSIDTDFIRDPRRDSGSTADNIVEETVWASLSAAYDIKTWKAGTLFAQMDVGYYSGDVGSIEVAVDIAEQSVLNPEEQDLTADDPFANFQFVYPSAGTLTQNPVSLSGVWQFRPRSPFRPYAGLGVGYLNASLSDSPSLQKVNSQLAGIDFTWSIHNALITEGVLPAETIVAEAQSDWFYVLQGGLEYNVNRHWSVYMDTRFMSTNARVTMRALGYKEFGLGIQRTTGIDDVEGIGSEDLLIQRLLSLSVEDAVLLIADITDESPFPQENERAFFTSFPVYLGTPIRIQIPNPAGSGTPTNIDRQSKLFVQGGDIKLDAYSVGVGFRYRF